MSGDLTTWLAAGPGAFTGETPLAMLVAAAEAFADFTGEKPATSSVLLDRFEIEIDRAGYRGNSIKYAGKIKWILILPKLNVTE